MIDMLSDCRELCHYTRWHPACAMVPMMAEDELDRLGDDIARRGLVYPVTLHDDLLLDGRSRLAACDRAGVEPRFEQYQGGDPYGFSLSLNLERRHLTAAQRAAMAANAMDSSKMTRDEAAHRFRVSAGYVTQASRIRDTAPDLFEELLAGETSMPRAQVELGLYERHDHRKTLADLAVRDLVASHAASEAEHATADDVDMIRRLGVWVDQYMNEITGGTAP